MKIEDQLIALFRKPFGSINLSGRLLFCPICGELYPSHHNGVNHENLSPEQIEDLQNYYGRANMNAEEVNGFVLENKSVLAGITNRVINVDQTWIDAGFKFINESDEK